MSRAISNSLGAFDKDITFCLTSSNNDFFLLKLANQDSMKMFDLFATIQLTTVKTENINTELEIHFLYKSNKRLLSAFLQKRLVLKLLNNFLYQFKKRSEKWL